MITSKYYFFIDKSNSFVGAPRPLLELEIPAKYTVIFASF